MPVEHERHNAVQVARGLVSVQLLERDHAKSVVGAMVTVALERVVRVRRAHTGAESERRCRARELDATFAKT